MKVAINSSLSRLFTETKKCFATLYCSTRGLSNLSCGENDVIFKQHNDKGVIILNRPKQLNAYHIDMIKRISSQLKTWEQCQNVKMVIIKGTGKSFCAGGDIKIIASNRGSPLPMESSKEEYQLNNQIASLSIPFVALVDGLVMGGGNGFSVHAPLKVVSENALFAMPECGIGFFPDVGATHFLPRLTEKVGLFLALTGARLKGYDLYKVGLATHYVCSEKINDLEENLLRLKDPDFKKVDDFLTTYQEQWEEDFKHKTFSIRDHVGRIYNNFEKAKSVENIIENLQKDNSKWAQEQLQILSKMSPTSLKVTFRSHKIGSTMSLPDCLRMEYKMAYHMFNHNDFYEGVRALLIDKDQNPQWKPSTLKEITDKHVESFFAPPTDLPDLEF